ncbi:hypothetical protein EDEG_03971 [Edhazardia aedis USNM 41457]|uniref:Uncharacterized protein n=1 Tax=Edhazardia aedis (strain USNM 41457) TaxID=1003232 RepID=J9D0H9_EDHAE|nr:hypothetical protein EDEG_03971 [Edhazardia aedis USNM 41457]|eukprot:EJW01401.1 hypothetical protein EDEG_03971 [Edhazardia aedis USNM 41457]
MSYFCNKFFIGNELDELLRKFVYIHREFVSLRYVLSEFFIEKITGIFELYKKHETFQEIDKCIKELVLILECDFIEKPTIWFEFYAFFELNFVKACKKEMLFAAPDSRIKTEAKIRNRLYKFGDPKTILKVEEILENLDFN